MITAAIFDLGGVYFTDGTAFAVQKISKRLFLFPEEVANFLKSDSLWGSAYRKDKITAEKFWTEFGKKFQRIVDSQEMTRIWVASYEPKEKNIQLINKMRQAGMKTFFLSDNVKERAEHLQEKYQFLKNFDNGIFSHYVHLTKSEGKEIFHLALEMTKEKAEKVLYIDDKEENVSLACELGMQGILFTSSEQLEKELKKLSL